MNERLIEALLETTGEKRDELIAMLKDEGYDFVDTAKLGDYEMVLWRGTKTRGGQPIRFYEISLSHKGLDFATEKSQVGRQPGGSTDLLGRKKEMGSKLEDWLNHYGIIYIGSHNPRKLRIYRMVLKKYLPHLQISEPFKAFDDSEHPDYFTVGGRQKQLSFESLVETAADLFRRIEAALEYRPVKIGGGGLTWYWVLLPLPLEDAAIASGRADTKGEASLAARKAARKSGRRITKVRVHHPEIKRQQIEPGPERQQPAPAQP